MTGEHPGTPRPCPDCGVASGGHWLDCPRMEPSQHPNTRRDPSDGIPADVVHHSPDIDHDEDGWWWLTCACGYQRGPFPGREDATDEYGDHREASCT